MLATENDICVYIPQRPPIVMISGLVEASEFKIVSTFAIASTNIFVENGFLNESGIIENIAQTAAAGTGYKQIKENKKVELGYIAAIKDLEIFSLPKVLDVLNTTIEITNQVMDITIVNATVLCDNNVLAKCEMRIFIKS
jgi:3-hydroxyacyl-[acyl-carrier-protein] dehydratase